MASNPARGRAFGRVLQLDEALIERQREAYKVKGVDDDEEVDVKQQQQQKRQQRKRKAGANGEEVRFYSCIAIELHETCFANGSGILFCDV